MNYVLNNTAFNRHLIKHQFVWPKISVITPSFNQAAFVGQTLESVFGQGYPNLEFIVIDGASTDGSVEIIKSFSDKLAVFISEPDKGQSDALNKGFALASGDIMTWLNSDDRLAPNALFSVALAFMANDIDMVAGICEVYQDDQLIHRHLTSCHNGILPISELLDLDNGWNAGQFFYQPEVFFSKAIWQRAGGYVREDLFYSMDYELWCRFAFHKAKIAVLGVPLALFRVHDEQKTHAVEAFKRELLEVKQQFLTTHKIQDISLVSARPPVNWAKKLRVAFINDFGFLYGAGIAHCRIAGAFDLAGHDVAIFRLIDSSSDNEAFADIEHKVRRYGPDIIIFGNMHSVTAHSIELLQRLVTDFKVLWLTHDFWLLTGRCTYFSACNQYLSGCSASCPTSDEYPVLLAANIASAWQKKAELKTEKNFMVCANSVWAADKFSNAGFQAVSLVKLGFAIEMFKPSNRETVRQGLGIPSHTFCVAFSASSLSDPRKGGDILFAALEQLAENDKDNVILLLIGRTDIDLSALTFKTIALGYIDSQEKLANILSAADIFVGSSAEETFGQVFIEAALCGTASVGFSGSGVDDAIVDGFTGIKLTDRTPQALASAIQFFITHPDKLAFYRYYAPIYARMQFSLEASYHSFFSILRKMGLVDLLGLPHKIALSKHTTFSEPSKAKYKISGFLPLLRVKVLAKLLDVIPQSSKNKLRSFLPSWLERKLLRLFFGQNTRM